MEPTNIAEILRNAPVGTLLYSPMVGYVNLVGVYDDVGKRDIIEVEQQFGHKPKIRFDKYGKYVPDGEPMLFPSKFRKQWDDWQNALFGFGHFITSTDKDAETMVITKHDLTKAYRSDGSCITICKPNCRWATDEEKIVFLVMLDKNGYYWDEDTLEVSRILPKIVSDEELTDHIDKLKMEIAKLKSILMLTEMYNVKDKDMQKTVALSINKAKTMGELDEITWECHKKYNPIMQEKF